MSRSELYANAVAEYLARRNDAVITSRLDVIYSQFEELARPQLGPVTRFPASRADLW